MMVMKMKVFTLIQTKSKNIGKMRELFANAQPRYEVWEHRLQWPCWTKGRTDPGEKQELH